MHKLITRPFSILKDGPRVYRLMTDAYARDWRNGVPAPFFEYAMTSSWADTTQTHRDMLYLRGGRAVAFCFYESAPGKVFFSLLPGEEALAPDMIEHAKRRLRAPDGKLELVLFSGQDALIHAAESAGFEQKRAYTSYGFDLSVPLPDAALPDGFRFARALDPAKVLLCSYKGFDHEAEGPWDGDIEPALRTVTAPHAFGSRLGLAVEAPDGEYACWAGMWWVRENHLAYLEPLCVIPKYRRMGIASATLKRMSERMKKRGATFMTGGGNPLYRALGGVPYAEERTYIERA